MTPQVEFSFSILLSLKWKEPFKIQCLSMSEAIPRKHLQSSTIRRTTSKREINDEDLVKIGETKVLEIDFDAFFSYMMKSTKEAGAKVESFAQPLHFLHSCGACRCPLGSEHDIFIYRGDRAFCSIGCREEYMQNKC
ncbi:uncharacterized protein LOC109728169 isoform X1 [Ananas comosus]|uniref:Uncharacterized protein LOC109728169 isoform X1 n=1 Tax=Ananas comosus TaxID=4615 RepID=A0A6P5HL69_ANACO|nr:uncharacterized protein LOC109728169 isoform X1 [Ananas comosus]